ncbi:unnamed protein product [Ambrosiozyma monospora]|uniref:Unnamed protein product n=1 Tax=Ambrosiozyma monospora TaxID=43982 RepID=A0A9W7DHS2_AMBMO|nr:unnamed protein product [Ambrosiozyma monospora]
MGLVNRSVQLRLRQKKLADQSLSLNSNSNSNSKATDLSEVTDLVLQTKAENSQQLIEKIEEKLNQIELSQNYQKYWKYDTDLRNYQVSFDPLEYENSRLVKHIYDPRVSFTVYLNHIKKQFQKLDPLNNDPTQDITIPFSWQDWIDLSVLNQYLEYDEDDKPNCKDIIVRGSSYKPSNKFRDQKLEYSPSCIDSQFYNGSTDKSLLPGFNFVSQGKKATFIEKQIQAKSYMLSGAPIPNSILFLSENGTYEVFPTEDKTMMQSGLFEEFKNDHGISTLSSLGNNLLVVNPIEEFESLTSTIPPQQSSLRFDQLFTKETNFEYKVPFESFIFNDTQIVNELEERNQSDSLKPFEKRHLQSLKYSQTQEMSKLPKSFFEVNINWPAKFKGHKLTENGGHYDYRFFNTFLSESKLNQFDDVSEKRKIILHRLIHTWLQFTYKQGYVSFLAHGTLLSWYWDGLVFEWDDDIDVQMPIMDLNNLSMHFNGSMIVQDLKFGFHKFFLDVSNSITHRTKGNDSCCL